MLLWCLDRSGFIEAIWRLISAIKIFVGKRVARHSHLSKDTNQLCVSLSQKAWTCGPIEKASDPFVFGRGAEEIELHSESLWGFLTQLIPGKLPRRMLVPASGLDSGDQAGRGGRVFGLVTGTGLQGWSIHRSCFSGTKYLGDRSSDSDVGDPKKDFRNVLFMKKLVEKNLPNCHYPKWNPPEEAGSRQVTLLDISRKKSPRKSSPKAPAIIIICEVGAREFEVGRDLREVVNVNLLTVSFRMRTNLKSSSRFLTIVSFQLYSPFDFLCSSYFFRSGKSTIIGPALETQANSEK